IDHGVLADEDVAVDLHGVGGGVAVFVVCRVVAEEVDRLPAFEVDEAQHFAAPHDAAPAGARGDDFVRDDLSRDLLGGAHAFPGTRPQRSTIKRLLPVAIAEYGSPASPITERHCSAVRPKSP